MAATSTSETDFEVCLLDPPCAGPALNKDNATALGLDYTFELIPDCPAATAAGYTAEQRARAQLWYSAVVDGDRFYYAAWFGPLFGFHLSTILVCRNLADGALVYAVNTGDFNLDTAPNAIGDASTICRTKIAISEGTLYLGNVTISNIGPQLYAVDKATGALKWACAYYTPTGQYITTKGNYAQFTGAVQRVFDLNPVVATVMVDGVARKYVFVGVSSPQNVLNYGSLVSGFPVYSSQGFMYCIEDLGTSSQLVWQAPTCAPLLKVGDTIVKGGDPAFDPFRPDSDVVVIESVSAPGNLLASPSYLANPPAPGLPNTCPVAARFVISSSTTVSPAMFQPIWSLAGVSIYQDANNTTPTSLAALVSQWQTEQAGLAPGATVQHVIWAYVSPAVITQAQAQPANVGLRYFKQLSSGHVIDQPADAQGLNYWGNSTWGGDPVVDVANNLLIVGTGQAHDEPRDESIYYNDAIRNFRTLKTAVVDVIDRYAAEQATLKNVEDAKETFCSQIRSLALDVSAKSPRGRMSYSDAIMGFYIRGFTTRQGVQVPAGSLAFAVRTVPWDSYTFLGTERTAMFPIQALDGDVSSGIQQFVTRSSRRVVAQAKHALTAIVNLTRLNNDVIFDHTNLAAKGVELEKLVFSGPNGTNGGSNYQADSSDLLAVSQQANLSFVDGGISSTGVFERHVTQEGALWDFNNTFVTACHSRTGKIMWETALNNRGNSQLICKNGLAFTEDGSGNLYVLDASNGAILWKADGASLGLKGGIVAPAIAETGQVVWTNNYSVFGIIGSAGPNGAVFSPQAALAITKCTDLDDLMAGKSFTSWDMAPKTPLPTPFLAPINSEVVQHSWSVVSGELRVAATHTLVTATPAEVTSFTVSVDKFNGKQRRVTFNYLAPQGARQISYQNLELINANAYRLNYTALVGGVIEDHSAWLDLN